MRSSISFFVIALVSTLTVWPSSGRAQSDRDFVFDDEDGHLVVRFVGTGARGLDASQVDEVLNAELSSMVHDRLRADLLFEAEPRDSDWAEWMEPQIAEHVRHAGPEFSDIFVQCRAASCRVIMEQPVRWSIPEHQVVLGTVQKSLEAFVAAHRHEFEAGFMITAYDQEYETSHIKAFLRRAKDASPEASTGG